MLSQKKIWNKIAPLWHEYKTTPTPFAIEFLKKQKGNVLDLGCGSGRNFTKTNAKIHAVDFSQEMLNLAEKKAKKQNLNIKIIKAKATKLPFKNNFFDSAIAIAVFHCIRFKFQRKKALKELHRVLKPKANALITVWDKQARRFKNKSKNFKVPWNIDKEKIFRYYYLYDKEEFETILKQIGFKIIKRIKTRANIVIIVEKI